MMKKLLIPALALGIVVVLSFGMLSFAYAQGATPPAQTVVPQWSGRGGMMQGGMMGGMMHGQDGTYGPLHEYMLAALAEGLDMTVDALQARIDNGETPYQVAQAQGLSDEQIATLFNEAHTQALQAAVEAGALTQEQADMMQDHHQQMWQNGGPGAGGCMGGGRGGRGSRQTQP